jgi:hypothetical protein
LAGTISRLLSAFEHFLEGTPFCFRPNVEAARNPWTSPGCRVGDLQLSTTQHLPHDCRRAGNDDNGDERWWNGQQIAGELGMADRVGTNRQPRGTTPEQTANICSQSARSPGGRRCSSCHETHHYITHHPDHCRSPGLCQEGQFSKGNLFVIFGEPDIAILPAADGQIHVQVKGVDVFDPSTREVRNDGADGIACWFIDSDYNEESCFVRQAYFLGTNDPYKALKTTLKAEIDEAAWETLHNNISRPFEKPESGRIAVKVINHLGDEAMKVFRA